IPHSSASLLAALRLCAKFIFRLGLEISQRMASERALLGVSALLFAASTAVTIVWCASMSTMAEMPMAGGWTMSMAWMRMPGQTWPGAAVSFLGMWVVMMVAMMLPSLVPMLWRYREAVGRTRETRIRSEEHTSELQSLA